MKKKFTLLYGLLASSLCLPVGHSAPKGDDPYSYTLPEIVVYGKRADAYYYGDYDSGLALFTLHEPELARLWQTENGLPRTLATLAQITASPVNHRRAIRAYLQAKHYRLEESARQLRAHSRDGSLTADFDTADRLTNLHSEIHPT